MEFKGQIYNTKKSWSFANVLANETLINCDCYTSKVYQSTPVITEDEKFILVELKGFETELKEAGFNFVSLNKSIIKQVEIL